MPGEDDYYRDAENIEFTHPNANEDITIYVSQNGTETSTIKYLNKGTLGKGFVLRPSQTVTIIRVGNKTYRNPITVSTAGLSWTKKIKDFNEMVIRITVASTEIRLLIL